MWQTRLPSGVAAGPIQPSRYSPAPAYSCIGSTQWWDVEYLINIDHFPTYHNSVIGFGHGTCSWDFSNFAHRNDLSKHFRLEREKTREESGSENGKEQQSHDGWDPSWGWDKNRGWDRYSIWETWKDLCSHWQHCIRHSSGQSIAMIKSSLVINRKRSLFGISCGHAFGNLWRVP